MITKHFECSNCDAVYNLKHENDKEYYKPEFCPFCGEPVGEEENFDVDEADE